MINLLINTATVVAKNADYSNVQTIALLSVSALATATLFKKKKKARFKSWLLTQYIKLQNKLSLKSKKSGKQNFLLVIVILFFAALLLGAFLYFMKKSK